LQLADWEAKFPEHEAATLSINLSMAQLEHPELLSDLETASQAGGITPAALGFELPDRVLDAPNELLIERLWAIRSSGFRLILKDFGAGSTSLQTLYRLPIDALKLTPTLLAGIEDGGRNTQLIQAVAAIGESLGVQVIVTGIESEAQLEKIRQLGFQYAQGHEIAEPVPADAVDELIKQPPIL
ncbi:MAG: EAL domain-containing protein, partial [Acidobacteriota bacterium]